MHTQNQPQLILLMARLLKTSVWLYLCFLLFVACSHATTGGPVQVGYLVDYMFSHLDADWDTTSSPHPKVSDWDIDSKAGTLGYVYWQYLTVTDSSTVAGVEMRKPFLPQTSGTISVEFRVYFHSKMDGMVWAVRADRDNSLVEFRTSGGGIGYVNSTGTYVSLISSYTTSTSYTIHADVNLTSKTADLSINGVPLASGNVWRNTSLTQASQFYLGTPTTDTGVFRLYYLTITKGYKIYERFTNATAGAMPPNWTASTVAGSSAVQAAYGSSPKDILSFQLVDSYSTAANTLSRTFTSSTGKLVWEYKFMQPAKVNGLQAQLRGGTSSAVTIATNNGGISYVNSSGAMVEIWPGYRAKMWYVIRAVVDPATQKADIYINGKIKASQVAFATATSAVDNVFFTSSVAAIGMTWLDDIYVYDFQPEPSDYVPAPQAVTTTGYNVGMQTFFSGWRDGQHCGWDWIYRYPSHDPYLGFYDNGNPEAMDWQLKWMAESGVNFFLDCWYKNNSGIPMKEPQFEYTEGPIHNAYFYAKYSDKVKFAIADYSLGATSAADFQAYYLPYWIEYYFKDPRYFVIPGPTKGYPVVALGSAEKWVVYGTDEMKKSITALRAALGPDGLGYDGVYVLATYSWADKAVMDSLYAAGVDYCYAYWGGSTIATTQSKLNAQYATGSLLKPIADVGQGWNGEAWDVFTLPGTFTTLADFGAMSSWVRNTFMTSSLSSGLSSSMVLYDNWNEYGEGHFICPTNVQGFGYLDQIRANFTSTTTVSNVAPTATQKARFGVLYTRGWEGRVWAFDSLYPDTEGWVVNAMVTGLAQNKGYLEGTLAGADPSLVSRDGYAIDAAQYNVIKVRLQNNSTGTSARFSFITNSDATYTTTKSKTFAITASSSAYIEYSIDMSSVPGWSGTIRQLRFDPVEAGATTGTFSIDYIKVTTAGIGQAWEFASGTEGWTVKVQINNFALNNGCIEGTITGTDPSIWCADGCTIDAGLYKKVKVRMKNSTAGTAAKLYFITTTDTTYNEAKAKSVTITANDTNYTEYTFDMSALATWTGTIRRFRLDPIDSGASTGNFSIDYIRVMQ